MIQHNHGLVKTAGGVGTPQNAGQRLELGKQARKDFAKHWWTLYDFYKKGHCF